MKSRAFLALALVAMGAGFHRPALAIPTRNLVDVIWARQAPAGTVITLDGKLDEPAWASAESKTILYGQNNGDPGSGYKGEGGHPDTDPDKTRAIVKFLVVGNQLYMGYTVPDTSIGGGPDFNKADGILMAFKNHRALGFPKGPAEILYSWWYPNACDPNPQAVGKMPSFRGQFYADTSTAAGRPTYCDPRPAAWVAAWDAATFVRGITNSDAGPDTSFTMEMRVSLDSLGYDVTQPQGDVIEFNVQIRDCDYNWPLAAAFAASRSWWQSPWALDMFYNQVQIWSKPSVTLTSGPVPSVPEDMDLHTYASAPNVTIDGHLNEPVWSQVDSLRITYDDDALRATYPSVLKYRSGQYEPAVNGNGATANIVDPGDMTVHWFFKGDSLFLGFDVRDQYVQYVNLTDRWDGVVTQIDDRGARGSDHNLPARSLTFHVGPGGTGVAEDYLLTMRDTLGGASFALALKPNTTVDTTGDDTDEGYQAELKLDLTKLGYPHGLGDGVLWVGFTLYDGDSFGSLSSLSYATRTWFAREGIAQGNSDICCPAYVYMTSSTVDVPIAADVGDRFAIRGNAPNPFRAATVVQYVLDRPAELTLEVYDLTGRRVATRALGFQSARAGRYAFTAPGLHTGLYMYRLKAFDRSERTTRTSGSGKMMVLQ